MTPETQVLVDQLEAVDVFAFGGVGFTGAPNRGETLTRQLAARPDAVDAFVRLLAGMAPVARLYAYWALRTLAPSRADPAALADDHAPIKTMTGCILGRASVGALAARIADPDDAFGRPLPAP